jgi:hypothetical protein
MDSEAFMRLSACPSLSVVFPRGIIFKMDSNSTLAIYNIKQICSTKNN